MSDAAILAFPGCLSQAKKLAELASLPCYTIDIHQFPDGESKLTLPGCNNPHWIIYTSLDQPNSKLVELLLLTEHARQHGCQQLTLVAPYMAYMRQDMAFRPGEVISQQVIGHYLSGMFDNIITVDPHLHRIHTLDEVMPDSHNFVLSAATAMGKFLADDSPDLLLGPDEESRQWVEAIASIAGVDFSVAAKTRINDANVVISLPATDFLHKRVVLVDDMISTGHTIIETAKLLQQQQAASIDVLVTHALFDSTMTAQFHDSGISHVWSSDSVTHKTNSIALAATLYQALAKLV